METRAGIITLYKSLDTMVKKGNVKFKLLVFKNLKQIEAEIKFLESIERENQEILKDYQEQYYNVMKEFGTEKDGQYVIEKKTKNFNAAIKALREVEEKNQDSIKLFQEKQNEYQDILKEEIELEFEPVIINEDLLPDDLTDKELEGLINFGILII